MRKYLIALAVIAIVTLVLYGREEKRTASMSSSSATPEQKVPQQFPTSKTTNVAKVDSEKILDETWKIEVDQDGRVQHAIGGLLKGALNSPQSAQKSANKIAKELGFEGAELYLPDANTNESALTRSFFFRQRVAGFEVYQGGLTLIGKSSGDLFMINSALKNVRYDGQIKHFDQLHGSQAIAKELKASPQLISLKINAPVLVEVSPQVSHLAWVYDVELTGAKKGSHEVVVSAETGEILHMEARYAN